MRFVITIDLGTLEYYDGRNNEFVYKKGGIVRFEYSLKAVYDWEGKWKKPFLKSELTDGETVDFYMTMALDPIDEQFITPEVMRKLATYIKDSNTATTFFSPNGQNGDKTSNTGKVYTAEELYAIMFQAGIPLEFENRNLNRLFTILKIISTHNAPKQKMSRQDIYRQNAELNRQRREQMKTKG